ncbi:winged helix-turn-helix domain-containing protein [Streptomonospora sp. S1-112]|uniref:Winged helix-turn-helix domain-containing protein n=1 Tax=Streptomonospora mangrovi TaxID=2883123 RepID=A0A9X3SMY4_9ACTN|nr:BTAD domain-containing putative transcriptional regulator [Streptomonospora mangrovi]MDA0564611.1 winged helix-turn-helix domain-containing protein [Streptomonospora mangrovi]
MKIGMLGPFEVRDHGGALADVPGARLRGLLTALALDAGRVVPKPALVDFIWGQAPPADAANALQRLVSRLRKALPEGAVEGSADGYRLAADPDDVDAVRFARLLARARADDGPQRVHLLREAAALWRGPALRDVGLADSPALDAAAARLGELRLAALEDRFDTELALGRGADLLTELSDLVAEHPVRERLVAALMRALAATGRAAEALRVYQRTRQALADELGADPSPELSALHVSLLRGEAGPRAGDRRTNVRAELTSYIGKDADVAAVRGLLAEHRLTTLTGPGGSGKTRLAAETARALLDDLPDGAWLVELAAARAEGDVARAALAGLGLRDALLGDAAASADPVDRLAAAVRDREALLILDNCEHVIEEAAAFAHRVLGECRRLRILATSREPLGITGEALWPVEPLAVPDEDAGPEEIAAAPAVRLLRDRARAVRGGGADDACAPATMARVCRALDGMPLAIELAAARLRTMSLDQLANRLSDRFRLLTGGSRTAVPQHRTLRAVVDWSWDLLSDAERAVLRRLSVFAGGASLEAAEQVCAGGTVAAWQVFDLLTALTEKSLVRAEGGGAPRYRMLDTIREYAADRLAEAGESAQARAAHLACFTELAETAEPHLRRAEQLEWLAVLEAEHGNIAAAMRGALAAGDAHGAMRLAAAAGWFWWLGGHKAEGGELLLAAANAPGDVPEEIRAVVYALVVMYAGSGLSGDEHEAEEWIHRCYELSLRVPHRHPALGLIVPLEHMLRSPDGFLPSFERLLDDEDPWVRALARLHLGKMRIVRGHGGDDAEPYLEMALAEFEALGERFGISFALTELADRLATRGDLAAACAHLERAVGVVTEAGAVEDAVRLRARQARLYWLLGEEAASAAAVAEAERWARRVTWPNALAQLAFARAELARWRGDTDEAHRHLAAAADALGEEARRPNIRVVVHDLLGYLADDLTAARKHRAAACEAAAEAGHPPMIAQALVGLADLALRCGQHEGAARLLAAGDGVRGLPDRAHPDALRVEEEARRLLGDTRFAEAAAEGTRTPWTRLVAATLAS